MTTPNQRGKVIQIFLPDGDPRGTRVAEITTRTIRAIEIPRDKLAAFFETVESGQVGVYFLFGQNPDDDPELYIGQTGVLRDRLKLQRRDKAFWTRAVLIVSGTNNITQTHAQYLEWRSINEAREVGRYKLANGNAGGKPYTPAPMEAECEEIYETLSTLLATLGHPVFEPILKSSARGIDHVTQSQKLVFFCRGSEADGRGVFTEDGFVLLAGSNGRSTSTPSMKGTDELYRERLIEDGTAQMRDGRIFFIKDHLTGSPSRAAAILMGRSANGWTEWKTEDERTADEVLRNPPPEV
jgi:Domain of unknown function (DUF4357)